VTFARLRLADWVVLLAALALLLLTAADWYSTTLGDDARRTEELSDPSAGGAAGQVERDVREQASLVAEGEERNAWQPYGLIDWVVLAGILGTVAAAIWAAFMRAAGRRYGDRVSTSAIAGGLAAATALLVTYRILQEPGFDGATTVKAGAPLALAALGAVAYAAATAVRHEESGTELREVPPVERPAA
jgi:hypothetical protein